MQKKESPMWFPMWVDKWLFGSTRIELTIDQRAIWTDFLALATKDNGYIRANVGVPYPLTQLAGMLIVTEEQLRNAIARFIETGKIRQEPDDTLYVVNWEEYKFSDRYRRKVSAQHVEQQQALSLSGSLSEGKEKTEEKSGEENIQYSTGVPKNGPAVPKTGTPDIFFDGSEFTGISEEHLQSWRDAFPAVDLNHELKAMRVWLCADWPVRKKVKWGAFIVRWLAKEQDRGGSSRGASRVRGDPPGSWLKMMKEREGKR